MEGVTHIIHCANPIPVVENATEEAMVRPAEVGMQYIMEAASKYKV